MLGPTGGEGVCGSFGRVVRGYGLAMMLDLIDRAFLDRRASSPRRPRASPTVPAAAITPPAVRGISAAVDPVVATLLDTAAGEWQRLVSRVEAALARGARVVALAGRERAEGRTTVARGIVAILCASGHHAEYRTGPLLLDSGGDDDRSPGCLIVDAGVWFPPGPVHRGRLAKLAIGSHAAILVRREVRPACPAHEQALAALGIHPLGEVVTFAGDVRHAQDQAPS